MAIYIYKGMDDTVYEKMIAFAWYKYGWLDTYR